MIIKIVILKNKYVVRKKYVHGRARRRAISNIELTDIDGLINLSNKQSDQRLPPATTLSPDSARNKKNPNQKILLSANHQGVFNKLLWKICKDTVRSPAMYFCPFKIFSKLTTENTQKNLAFTTKRLKGPHFLHFSQTNLNASVQRFFFFSKKKNVAIRF